MSTGTRHDVPPINTDPSVWSDRRSGLEMLFSLERARGTDSPEEARKELAALRATPATWREWRGVKNLRLLEALALHHHLDPRAMGLTDRSNERFWTLWSKYGESFNSVLGIFAVQLVWLTVDIQVGRLAVVEVGDPLENSVVSAKEFLRIARGRPVLADPCPRSEESDPDAAVRTPLKFCSPLVEALVDASTSLFRTVADGGSYVPGDPSTMPDVDAFFRHRYPWMSKTKRRQGGEWCRPPEMPRGRPKKKARAPRR